MAIDQLSKDGFLTTTIDAAVSWAQRNSMWPMPMGISCCAIEMMAFAGPRFDCARFGSEKFGFTPRQSDLLIVAGTVTYKMRIKCPNLNGVFQWVFVLLLVVCLEVIL